MHISGQKPGSNIDQKHWTVQNENRIKMHFKMYLSECNIQSRNLLTDNDPYSKKEFVFLAIVRDYINFHISLDMFCVLLGELWMISEKTYNLSKETKIEEMCHYGFELQWYLRNNPARHINWLTEILEYYEKNRTKIEKT